MQVDHFSLTRVRLKQYRSIADADVPLGALVFLVGPNGSGKSNFVDGMSLVSESLRTSVEQALHHRGGFGQVRRKSTGHPTRFSVCLSFQGPGFQGEYALQVASARQGGFRISGERCDVVRTVSNGTSNAGAGGGTGAESGFRMENGQITASTERVMPAVDPRRPLLAQMAKSKAFRPVFEGLAGFNAVQVNTDAMRRLRTPDPGHVLRRDAANVAGVLHRLGRSAGGREDRIRIESYLRQIVPGIHGVTRRSLGGQETVEFAQDVPGSSRPWRFSAQSVSEGTLRALGVLVALFARTDGAYGAVAVEEPETGLHPSATGALLQALRDAADRRQVIAVSHSPDLLDHEDIDPAELRAVRSVGGRTLIGPLDESGAFTLHAHLGTPGQLQRTDQLLPQPTASADEHEKI